MNDISIPSEPSLSPRGQTRGAGQLCGRQLLLVEDEIVLADLLIDYLKDQGAQVVGPVSSVKESLKAIARHSLDAAILDVNLRGERTYAIADDLRARGIPFIFLTGYASWAAADYGQAPVLNKPFDHDVLLPTLISLLNPQID